MVRSVNFFDQVTDVTLLAMLLERSLQVAGQKIDIDELLEKAEICFLKLVGFDASHSDERLWHILAQQDQSLDLVSMSEIARAFSLRNQGGPIYKCLEIYAKIKSATQFPSTLANNQCANKDTADLVTLLFWLEMSGNSAVQEILLAD